MKNGRLYAILSIATILLLIPFIGMQFSEEVKWGIFDFVLAAFLLFGTGLTIELIMRKVSKPQNRIALCVAIVAALVIVWIELAVGIFGSPIAGS